MKLSLIANIQGDENFPIKIPTKNAYCPYENKYKMYHRIYNGRYLSIRHKLLYNTNSMEYADYKIVKKY